MSVDVTAPTDETVRFGLTSLEANLIDEFCPPLDPDEVRRCCADAIASLGSAPVQPYIVVLVEHDVRQKLRETRNRLAASPGGRP